MIKWVTFFSFFFLPLQDAKIAVVCVGLNDGAAGLGSIDRTLENVQALCLELLRRGVEVCVCGIPHRHREPTSERTMNDRFRNEQLERWVQGAAEAECKGVGTLYV